MNRRSMQELISIEMQLDVNEREIEMEIRANLSKYKDRDAPIPCYEEKVPVKTKCYGKRKNFSQNHHTYIRLVDMKCTSETGTPK